MSSKARTKARGLIALAVDKRTPEEERITASVRAVALIAKYDLLSSPLDAFADSDDETIRAAHTIFEAVTNPDLVSSLRKVSGRFKRRR